MSDRDPTNQPSADSRHSATSPAIEDVIDSAETSFDPALMARVEAQHAFDSGEHTSAGAKPDVPAERQAKAVRARPTKQPSHPTAPTSFEPRQQINQYELIRELGRGGMGQVFLARDTKLARKVAIKFLHTQHRKYNERFLAEARATARCAHENIVVIYEVGEVDDTPYMALEYLEGDTLADHIKRHPFSAHRAVETIIPVVRALARAHSDKIIHRDLKPENIFISRTGTVKVLDFGIAKVFTADATPIGAKKQEESLTGSAPADQLTRDGAIMGTMTYMSPEQWGVDHIDERSDLWAIGVVLFEMLTGENPLAGRTMNQLAANAARLNTPMPSLQEARPDIPTNLCRIVERCLQKRKADRHDSAEALLTDLEPLLPSRFGRKLKRDECPYPGLIAFQESDADRFFGRSRDILRAVSRVREMPLLAVVGPSGVGKSSFIRAGVIPTLKAAGEDWEVFVARPGRQPLAALASLLQPVTRSFTAERSDRPDEATEHAALVERLRNEPGYLGSVLRARAERTGARILLFVDQFEELYTLVPEEAERKAFTGCLSGAADDVAAPIRVVTAMRSDFLDRVAEDEQFTDDLTRGLIFLQPPHREGLTEALTQPATMAGYQFEDGAMVREMLSDLEGTPGALPLLQFAASKLWEKRDEKRQLLTRREYESMGGIAGALATHADEVLTGLAPSARRTVRQIFTRLITSEGTRAIVDVVDLKESSANPAEVERLLAHLVTARLLVIQTRSESEGPAVEIVHESLISTWPTLRRWLDESHDDAQFLEQLRNAAKQWRQRDRPNGLLWRGEIYEEAKRWQSRYSDPVSPLEQEYLDAVFAMGTRASRRRRTLIISSFIFLLVLVAAAAVALVWIRNAEQDSARQARVAKREASRARAAEKRIQAQIDLIRAKEREKARAEKEATAAKKAVKTGQVKLNTAERSLARSYRDLQKALKKAEEEKQHATQASIAARKAAEKVRKLAEERRKANEKLKQLLARERARVQRLRKMQRKIATELD